MKTFHERVIIIILIIIIIIVIIIIIIIIIIFLHAPYKLVNQLHNVPGAYKNAKMTLMEGNNPNLCILTDEQYKVGGPL